jgi:hypothetical protein
VKFRCRSIFVRSKETLFMLRLHACLIASFVVLITGASAQGQTTFSANLTTSQENPPTILRLVQVAPTGALRHGDIPSTPPGRR